MVRFIDWLRSPPTRAETSGLYIAIIVIIAVGSGALSNAVKVEGKDREKASTANVEARFNDCENSNKLRAALREETMKGQEQLPYFLKLLPSLNTQQFLQLNNEAVRRRLAAYANRDCGRYADEALAKSTTPTVPKK